MSNSFNYLSFFGSIIGITAVVLVSKGSPVGQGLTIIFSVLYGISSIQNKLYGEAITYIGMSAPMAVLALVNWIRNPSSSNKGEVKVNNIKWKEWTILPFITGGVTLAFYFILKELKTAQLIVSTISVATSFIAAYLTARRSKFYALAYCLNDIILIILWTVACAKDISNIPLVINFVVFLSLDTYGFINWNRMEKRQKKFDKEFESQNETINL